jgi:hypothetical protein
LVVNCSFWIGTTLIVTFGWARWNAVAARCQIPFNGSAVPLCHQVIDTVPLPELPPFDPLLLHAASTDTEVTATSAAPPYLRMLRLVRMFVPSVRAWEGWDRRGAVAPRAACADRCRRNRR